MGRLTPVAPSVESAPATVADLPTAQPLNDRWELIAPLGDGAMGEVWRGRHRVLGHEVAVKRMKAAASRDAALVARFVREARIAAQLRHRHIARVEDFGTSDDGRPFLVMELLQGESLEERLQREGRIDPYLALTVARHVGAACDVAHAAGIVHRDLKPSNCFLVKEDGAPVVKVIDFGVARWADGLKLTQHEGGPMLLGTPSYMAPEQIEGSDSIDGRADLWSLAVMLYELLTGRLPFEASTLPALLYAVATSAPPPPSRHAPSLGTAVDAWAVRALARPRDARYPTGHALAEGLAEALAGVALGRASLPSTRETPAVVAPTERSFPMVTAPHLARPSLPEPEGRSTFDAVSISGPTYGRDSAMSVAPPARRAAWVASLAAGVAVGIGVAVWLGHARPATPSGPTRVTPAVTVVPPVVVPPTPVALPSAPPAPSPAPVAPPVPVPVAPPVAPVTHAPAVRVAPPPPAVRAPVRPTSPIVAHPSSPTVLTVPVAAPPSRPPPRDYNPDEP